jgi:hypothetical protein
MCLISLLQRRPVARLRQNGEDADTCPQVLQTLFPETAQEFPESQPRRAGIGASDIRAA